MGCRSRTNTVNDETVICLQSATEFYLNGGTLLSRYRKFMRIVSGRLKYLQQNHECRGSVTLRFR